MTIPPYLPKAPPRGEGRRGAGGGWFALGCLLVGFLVGLVLGGALAAATPRPVEAERLRQRVEELETENRILRRAALGPWAGPPG